MPSHVFAAHSWKSHYHCFVAISHFFLFLLLVNCENYFLLQEKMPICLFELESCCSLLAKSRAVVFNAHPEMSIPFCLYKGRNPFDIIYETSCGGGPSHVRRLSLCSTSATEASAFCLYIISGLTVEESRKERHMGDIYSRLTLPDIIFLRCNILVFKTLYSGFECFREI